MLAMLLIYMGEYPCEIWLRLFLYYYVVLNAFRIFARKREGFGEGRGNIKMLPLPLKILPILNCLH